ncbi:PAS domain-containing hybrid sensor histidine kinase/response regulator [Thiocystis violacea]|uniref:PAS domain-containing hybrid sensor histidine kinase/response regulator n=1 Tax=Thiocystis violacea TaxID=13725 RepID=UPI001908C215|nr:PAS domain-containing hybrid sensor histidine kinase/response regulator [Thiocystis violacea]MBK1717624.1 PAS domain-containing sensor histidine kinase [Thiocystis violacea]
MNADFAALLFRESPDALIATDTEGRVLYWSPGAETLFGYASEETAGRRLSDLVGVTDSAGKDQFVRRELLEQGSISYESLRHHKDGSLIYVAATGKAIRAGDGRLECLLFAKKDVTRMKVIRDAKLVDARFRELLESMPDGIVMVNLTGRIVFSNAQADALFGYDRGELRGQPIETLLPERFRAAHVGHRVNYFNQLRTRAMGMGLDLHGRRKDGSEFPVEISLSPLETEEGTLVSSAIRDMTERKRFERTLREQNIALEQASLAKDTFLASMSHELRTPLNAIIGFTGTLLMRLPGALNPEQDKQLTTIESSARHLLSLINDLLDLAKIESGKVEINPRPTFCGAVIEEVASALRPLAEGKGLRFEIAICREDLQVCVDQRAFSQILINLCNNAIKFTGEGRVGIACVEHHGHDQDEVEIQVSDSGAGIQPEDQARLFQAFTQLDASTTRRHEGTGLGLYLSRKLADLIGARIGFHTEPGQGSTFTLTLREYQPWQGS